ncbi:NfeD family protein [Algoriphagus sp. NG3]|uniref:NfeD family protein n=1 Tax=Algoriphagus sp. NG3 TaxID=3097546 RepID=UPI002A81CBC4|nr:NfeD family protein [Algoriphagus sp. NG3]WPR75409.1 NfeD family protein [Algoriphagus sp. NG3]
MEFLEGLDPQLKLFWYIAIPISLIFLLQTILTFVGSGGADGIEADFDGDLDGGEAPFQLFSLRNLINFLLGFSWSGISFYAIIPNYPLLLLVSLAIGFAFVYSFFLIIRQIQKLGEDNTFRLERTLGKIANVYLSIPGNMQGKGKIMASLNGSVRELDAMTEHDKIETNATVRIMRVESGNILIVEKL